MNIPDRNPDAKWHRAFKDHETEEAYIAAVLKIREAGGIVVRAAEDKGLGRRWLNVHIVPSIQSDGTPPPVGDDGKVPTANLPVADSAETIAQWMREHGRGSVLLYAPATIGVVIADFDPKLPGWVDAINGVVGDSHAEFESSGNLKPAEGERPAGRGGHCVWRAPVIPIDQCDPRRHPRHFSDTDRGEAFGELFYEHPGFGVILWEPGEVARVADLDDAECVDTTAFPAGRSPVLSKPRKGGGYTAASGSRHHAALLALRAAAEKRSTDDQFATAVAEIKDSFVRDTADTPSRHKGEWDRLAQFAESVRQQARDARSKQPAQRPTPPVTPVATAPSLPGAAISAKDRIAATGEMPDMVEDVLTMLKKSADPNGNTGQDGNEFFIRHQAEQVALHGGLLITDHHDIGDALKAITMMGGQARFTKTYQDIEWAHPVLTGGRFAPLSPARDKTEGSALAGAINRMSCKIGTKRGVGKAPPTFFIAHHKRYSTADTKILHADLAGSARPLTPHNSPIPIVHPFAEYHDKIRSLADAMPADEQEYAKDMARGAWILNVPHLEHADPELSQAVAANIAGGLYLRLHESTQDCPPPQMTIYPQKQIALLIGGTDVGKTAMINALCPPDMAEYAAFELPDDSIEDMNRRLIGRWFVHWDDCEGIVGRKHKFKSLVTATHPDVNLKHINIFQTIKTAWMIGSANRFHRSLDSAYENRFLPAHIATPARDIDMPLRVRVGAIVKAVADMRETLLVGAHILHESGGIDAICVDAPVGLGRQRAAALGAASSDDGHIADALRPMLFPPAGHRNVFVGEAGGGGAVIEMCKCRLLVAYLSLTQNLGNPLFLRANLANVAQSLTHGDNNVRMRVCDVSYRQLIHTFTPARVLFVD